MSTIRALLASLPLVLAAAPAIADALDPLDAVGYLMVGVRDGGAFELSGLQFTWEKTAPGHFNAVGSAEITMTITVTEQSPCFFGVVADAAMGSDAFREEAIYDFTRITAMTFLTPTTAEISGSGFCTGPGAEMCSSAVTFSVPTDAATFDRVYADFRSSTCP